MTISIFLEQLCDAPEAVDFEATMAIIAEHYHYTPTAFRNGEVTNAAGINEGSCKIFAFAQLNKLSEVETLACFGRFYREDVLGNPEGDDHANIRNFMQTGWTGIQFEGDALKPFEA